MRLGANVQWNTYWNLPQFVDLVQKAEAPFHLPTKPDGYSEDWDNAVQIPTVGRKFTFDGRVRINLLSSVEAMFTASRKLVLLYRGKAAEIKIVFENRSIPITGTFEVPIKGVACEAALFDIPTSGRLSIDVVKSVDFELVAVVESEYIQDYLSGKVLHPVLEFIFARLGGYRRLMDWCGLGRTESGLKIDKFSPNHYSSVPNLNRSQQNETLDHGSLGVVQSVIEKNPGLYWFNLPFGLTNDEYIRLGETIGRKMSPDCAVAFLNEAWHFNFQFVAKFQALRPEGMHHGEWYIRNAIDKINLFEQGAGKRFVRVAEWQAADNWAFGLNPWDNNKPSVPYIYENLNFFDALAIAPYIFSGVTSFSEATFLQNLIVLQARCSWWRELVDSKQMKLFAYEGLFECPESAMISERNSAAATQYTKRYLDSMAQYFDEFCVYTALGQQWGLSEGNHLYPGKFYGACQYIDGTINPQQKKLIGV